jgi:quercetin dioxygenase-like cupin family protein
MATARMPQPSGDDPVKVDPKHYKVEFENDRVRVVRIKYKPGEKSVMHGHPESIGVFLTDAHAKFTYPDGKSEDIKRRLGRCYTWMPLLTCRKTRAKSHSRSSKSS